MVLVWAILVAELLLYFIFKPFVGNNELFSVIIIIFNIPFVLFIMARYQKKISLILFSGFFIRIIFMFWDIYGRTYFSLPHSGDDSEGFLASGIKISNDLSLLNEPIYGGLYSKVLSVVFFLGPTDRIIGQYINVLLGITTIILVWKILVELKVSYKMKTTSLIVMILFPSGIVFSSIFLREALISFLVVFSFYIFLKWYKTGKIRYFTYSIIILLVGATLHTGVIGVLAGYIFMYLLYSHSKERLVYSLKSIISFFILTMLIALMSMVPLENIVFLNKFTHYMEDLDDLYKVASGGGSGGSSYLKNMTINNPLELIVFAPIKMLYFLSAPVPWDWRGLSDIVSFLTDGIVYLTLCLYPLLNFNKFVKRDPLILSLFIMLVTTIFIFGVGISNAGTAMRHRYKIYYLFIILFVLIQNKKSLLEKRIQRK